MTDKAEDDSSSEEIHPSVALKNKRKQFCRRLTLSIKHIREIIKKATDQANKRPLKKEIEQLRKDYESARDLHGQLYEFVEEEEHPVLDQWENNLTNDVFAIEEEVETCFTALASNGEQKSSSS